MLLLLCNRLHNNSNTKVGASVQLRRLKAGLYRSEMEAVVRDLDLLVSTTVQTLGYTAVSSGGVEIWDQDKWDGFIKV